jgi:hypothetical protein
MEVKTLQEQCLIKAVWSDSENPFLIRMLERMIDFNKLTVNTLVLLYHFLPNNDIIYSKFENTDKFKCENCGHLIGVCLQDCFERCIDCGERIEECDCEEYRYLNDDSDDD